MNALLAANDFLRTLPEQMRAQWLANGKTLHLSTGDVIEAGADASGHLFFPLSTVLGWVSGLQDGSTAAIALTGSEGMAGLQAMPGLSHQLVAMCDGHVFRVPAPLVYRDACTHPTVQQMLLQNLHALMAQAGQTALCNQHHSLQQRLVRLLRCYFDRTEGNALQITHGQLADLLGTRRERVSHVAAQLQKAGWIRCSRGQITVIDRPALFEQACDCVKVQLAPRP